MTWAILLLLAWGTFAFGAVYEWAYWPLAGGALVVGLWGMVRRSRSGRRPWPSLLVVGFFLLALFVSLQLVPLDHQTLLAISPATDQFARAFEPAYQGLLALRPMDPPRHPLTIDAAGTRLGLALLICFAVWLVGLSRGLRSRDLQLLVPAIALLGVVLSLVGIVQRSLWAGKIYGAWEPYAEGAIAFGPFVNRNHFAGWILMALPVVVGYFASQVARGMRGVEPNWRSRILWFSTPTASRASLAGGAILMMGFALTLTLSRSGISCLLIAFLVSALQVLRSRSPNAARRWIPLYLALVFGAAVTWTGYDAIAARFADVDMKLGGRADIWEDAWRIHTLYPWLGSGLNSFGHAMSVYQKNGVGLASFTEAHNDYLQLLVEGGWVFAGLSFLTVVALSAEIRRRFRERRDDPFGYWVRLGAVTGIVAIALQSVVEFSLQMPGNAAFFCVLCAIAIRRSGGSQVRSIRHRPAGPNPA